MNVARTVQYTARLAKTSRRVALISSIIDAVKSIVNRTKIPGTTVVESGSATRTSFYIAMTRSTSRLNIMNEVTFQTRLSIRVVEK